MATSPTPLTVSSTRLMTLSAISVVSRRLPVPATTMERTGSSSGSTEGETRFHDAAERYARGIIRVQRTALLTSPLTETFGALATLILLWVGMSLATGAAPVMRPEAFIAFLFVAARLMVPAKAIANYCLVSESTVRRWIKDRKLSSLRLPSGQYRISVADFKTFLKRFGMSTEEL